MSLGVEGCDGGEKCELCGWYELVVAAMPRHGDDV